jgi:hypothetical protein
LRKNNITFQEKLTDTLHFCSSHHFDGIIWSTLADNDSETLVLEIRKVESKEVMFSALNLMTNSFLWRDKKLEEPWWVNASAIVDGHIIFTVYMDTNNPDKKGIVVYSVKDLKLKWWNNDFSISEVGNGYVKGFTSKLGLKELVLSSDAGVEYTMSPSAPKESPVVKPVQYAEGMEYFETVKTFLAERLNLSAVSALEYLEAEKKIFISYYQEEDKGLANYLLVLSSAGDVLLREKLDGPVKGIGLDTFFILRGFLIFVRNKAELVSYKI